jgi:tryptophan synthase alpha chain
MAPEAATVTGLERIASAFEVPHDEGRAALMPYLMGGFPDHQTSVAMAEAYVEAGADLIELGVPFSDPLADGPVIHAAATTALGAGATLATVLEVCGSISGRIPVVLMCYANMALARGLEAFAADLSDAGAAGAILPDLPLEEAEGARSALAARGLALAPLVAPTTPAERRRLICRAATGFIYLVSDVGTTGERDELPAALSDLIAAVKSDSDVPVAVGFGIGTPEQAAAVGKVADGVIVGSRLVRAVAEARDPEAAAADVSSFIAEARDALAGRR